MKIKDLSALKLIYPEIITNCNTGIYITIDDGPSSTTFKLLELLETLNINATFFLTGKQIFKYSKEFEALKKSRHTIGNHSFYHVSAFKSSKIFFINSAKINANLTGSRLFRPPYGHLTPQIYNELKKEMRIILWSYMTYDFAGLKKINHSKIKKGAIIVLHDHPHTFDILKNQLLQIKQIAEQKRLNFSNLNNLFT
jgi:peptidoglycan/xylan/chitin deacetylase (PgdA/CDA1 family)